MSKKRVRSKRRGSALVAAFGMLMLLAVATTTYVSQSTQEIRHARRQEMEIQDSALCEAGVQAALLNLWKPFKANQNFTTMDAACGAASEGTPAAVQAGSIDGVGSYSSGVISYTQPDTYTRQLKVRCVGWQDLNHDGALTANEPQKTIDVTVTYTLDRSKVFDYTYFVNNYGWMDGFGPTDLTVNGDMRANGNFNFTNGSPTVNGSVYACANEKLSPAAAGLVNTPPVKMSNSTYITAAATNSRWRQGYNSATMGAKGSSQYESWRDYVFESSGGIVNNTLDGAVVADANGTKGWTRTTSGQTPTTTTLDTTPTREVTLPDLSDLTYYTNLSQTFVDQKATYGDGSANPNYGQGAYVQVWNTGTSSYQTLTTNGVYTGSAALVGTSSHPVKIHGPVTFTQDCAIKGYVSGQGTVYTGRNVHIVGSVIYSNAPDFRGSDQTAIDNANEKKDMIALAARGSVIMGDVSTFTDSYPLQYMTPPFTKGRYDDYGNWIPPFNAKAVDGTGYMKYQSVLGNSYIHSIASSVTQIDAVLYTNFVGGGDVGVGGGGCKFNGSIISKDEAIVVFSLPMYMNYDSRIRESRLDNQPLIDINLPRSPTLIQAAWQDFGFNYGG